MGEKIAKLRSTLRTTALLIGVALLAALWVRGTVTVSGWVNPFLMNLGGFATVVLLPSCVLLSLFGRTQYYAAVGFMSIAFIYGLGLWVGSLLYALQVWGWIAAGVGVMLAGVGVVVIAFAAAVSQGNWSLAAGIGITLGLIAVCRLASAYLLQRGERVVTDAHNRRVR